jgi:formylglycine-generating enzyme required for sulfatase activity
MRVNDDRRNPRCVSRLIALLVCPAIAAVLTGCGGSDTPPPPQPVAPQQVAVQPAAAPESPAPANNEPAAEERPVLARGGRPKPKAAQVPQQPTIDPSTNPRDVFERAGSDGPFERVSGPEGPISANSLVANFPPKGSDSSTFQTTESPETRPAPVRAATDNHAINHATDNHSAHRPRASATSKKKSAESKSPAATSETTESDQKKSLPSGFRALASYGYSEVGWPRRIRCQADGAEMALVTGGAVTVGHDGEPPESSPQITVVLDSFYMDVTEVTLKQYERYRKALKEERGRDVVTEPANFKSPPEFPVLGVSLKQCEFYARWAKKELPTEAEWERAARGEPAFPHPWGNGRAIWSQPRKRDTITAVKSFGTDVSPYGIYDLAGNAREWCSDRYSDTALAEAQKLSQTPLRNWKGARSAQPADFHVVKGNGPGWNAWYRVGMNSLERHADVGFRCVLRLGEKN